MLQVALSIVGYIPHIPAQPGLPPSLCPGAAAPAPPLPPAIPPAPARSGPGGTGLGGGGRSPGEGMREGGEAAQPPHPRPPPPRSPGAPRGAMLRAAGCSAPPAQRAGNGCSKCTSAALRRPLRTAAGGAPAPAAGRGWSRAGGSSPGQSGGCAAGPGGASPRGGAGGCRLRLLRWGRRGWRRCGAGRLRGGKGEGHQSAPVARRGQGRGRLPQRPGDPTLG